MVNAPGHALTRVARAPRAQAMKKWNKQHAPADGAAGRLDPRALMLQAPVFNGVTLEVLTKRAELLQARLAPPAARRWAVATAPGAVEAR